MKIEDVAELYYIAPIENVPSILEKGILSHNLVHGHDLAKQDFSMQSVQKIRARKIVPVKTPDGSLKTIHDHANFYFQPSNATLFAIKDRKDLCILRIRPEVLRRQDAVISTTNAAAAEAVFKPAKEGIALLDKDELYSDSWFDAEATPEANALKKKRRCAELLVPTKLHPSYIAGAFVPTSDVHRLFLEKFQQSPPIPVDVVPEKFFIRVPPQERSGRKVSELANVHFSRALEFLPTPPPAKKQESLEQGQTQLRTFFISSKAVVAPQVSSQDQAMPANITIKRGSLFDSTCKTLVNTVNCVGVMGKGIAKEFKKRHTLMFTEYKKLCKDGKVELGKPYLYSKDGVSIINFPTKQHWQNNGDIEGIKKGLAEVVAKAREWGLTSVAFPPLGCGNGNLKWSDVGPIMCKALADAPFKVEIYAPETTPGMQLRGSFLMK